MSDDEDVWQSDLDRIALQFGCESIVAACAHGDAPPWILIAPGSLLVPEAIIDEQDLLVRIAHQALMIAIETGDEPIEILVEIGDHRVCYVLCAGAYAISALVPTSAPGRKSMWRALRRSIEAISETDYAFERSIEAVLGQLVDEGLVQRVDDTAGAES